MRSFSDSLRRLLLLACLLAAGNSPLAWADTLKPFETDGCSRFPDGTAAQQTLWRDCCVRHDVAYWIGGTESDRLDADRALEQCVAAVGEPAIATLMLAGVRVGGGPYFPTSYRWGYGWSYPFTYHALDRDEAAQVNAERSKLDALRGAGVKSVPVLHRLLAKYDLLTEPER
ncbi:hypothetical protein GCM10025771_00300 [Niveibacterium umoris]|uniref:FAD-binding oxidoreductase n=1 Tax=Niveibacterium umoris TaxID=1193620 RepID=A0A840BU42_9RHOO|nr:hypothetical protein [Niveibacterium umoris]MBB4014909.1 hypothetical protein [Niveibacterium umoris]